MSPQKLIFISLIIIGGLLSCNKKLKKNNIPNLKLAKEFGIDSVQLIYQYYQKFGFTDVCEDLRMVSKLKISPKFEKRLPINADDLIKINNFSNKVDKIQSSLISFESNFRDQFYDIELDYIEFSIDNMPSVSLRKGEYEIHKTDSTSTLKIFDSESGLLYLETHRCD